MQPLKEKSSLEEDSENYEDSYSNGFISDDITQEKINLSSNLENIFQSNTSKESGIETRLII